jgi:hypothetical protein
MDRGPQQVQFVVRKEARVEHQEIIERRARARDHVLAGEIVDVGRFAGRQIGHQKAEPGVA